MFTDVYTIRSGSKCNLDFFVGNFCDLTYLLGLSLVSPLVLVINAREIRHNDGDGKGDDQNSGQRANATDQFA